MNDSNANEPREFLHSDAANQKQWPLEGRPTEIRVICTCTQPCELHHPIVIPIPTLEDDEQ